MWRSPEGRSGIGGFEKTHSALHDALRPVRITEAASLVGRHERILSFSLPILEHIDRHRRASEGTKGKRGRAILHGNLRKVIADLIAGGLGMDLQSRRELAGRKTSVLLVPYLASAFVIVLKWRVETEGLLPPTEVNELFQALVLPTLAAIGV